MSAREITRRAGPDELRDLLEFAREASLAFATERGVEALPVAFRWRDGVCWVGFERGAPGTPAPGANVCVVVDGGTHFYELRGLRVRGRAERRSGATAAGAPGLDWREVVPEQLVGWDYGALREAKRGAR